MEYITNRTLKMQESSHRCSYTRSDHLIWSQVDGAHKQFHDVHNFFILYTISELHGLVHNFHSCRDSQKGRNKRLNSDKGDAEDNNDGPHPTPTPPKGVNGVGGIAQRKEFVCQYLKT